MIRLTGRLDFSAPWAIVVRPKDDIIEHDPLDMFCDCRPHLFFGDVVIGDESFESSIVIQHHHLGNQVDEIIELGPKLDTLGISLPESDEVYEVILVEGVDEQHDVDYELSDEA